MQLPFLFILAILLLPAHQVHAQIKRGTVSVGINLNMQFSNNDALQSVPTDTYYRLGTLLTAESFVKDNLSIIGGIKWEYGNQHTVYKQYNVNLTYTNDIRTLSNTYTPTLGIRKYWMHSGGRLGLFIAPLLMVNYRVTNRTETTTNPNIPLDQSKQEQKKETWVMGFSGDIGMCYFIAPHFTLELSTPLIQANVQKKNQSFNLHSTLNNISYGVRYYF